MFAKTSCYLNTPQTITGRDSCVRGNMNINSFHPVSDFLNFEKSAFLFSTKAFRPSMDSSVP